MSSLSIIIPAYNESLTLTSVVHSVAKILDDRVDDYEIIVVNDASTDDTGTIADRLSLENPKVKALHNEENMNMGFSFRRGMNIASKDYVCMLPADDDITHDSLKIILGSVGKADLILAYHGNYEARVWLRRIVSKFFLHMMNFLFGLHLRYYNGPCIFPLRRLKQLKITTYGFACTSEMVVLLLKDLACQTTYFEVPMIINPERKGANFRVFRPKNFISVVKTITTLFWRVQIIGRFSRSAYVSER